MVRVSSFPPRIAIPLSHLTLPSAAP